MSALTFLSSPLGLGEQHNFHLEALDDEGVLYALRGVDTATRLFLIRPKVFFADYAPQLPAEVLTALGLADADAAAVFVIVHPGTDQGATTVNLLAPIVVNSVTNRAEQVVLEGDRWPLRAQLPVAS